MKEREGGSRPLTPEGDPARWEALVAAVVRNAEGELARRRRFRTGILPVIERWRRPVLSLSAALTAAGLALLLLVKPGAPSSDEATPILTEAVVPETVAAWLWEGYEPDPMEFVLAFSRSKP